MAQYKVPQDVEADDKLLGPFSFRQFVYLLVAGGCIAIAVALFQLFPLLIIIPAPIALFFLVLALPLKKDQPMETYLAAIVSYYLKPRTRKWVPGQKENTIDIIAPKKVDNHRTKDITGEEATHRLSFLADIVDTEGYAIKGMGPTNQISEELVAEANAADDMFETSRFDNLSEAIARDENARHDEVVRGMREAIAKNEAINNGEVVKETKMMEEQQKKINSTTPPAKEKVADVEKSNGEEQKSQKKVEETASKASIIELANNPDFSVATIAKEANRINGKGEGEVFISLH